jgi:hypothetical protein
MVNCSGLDRRRICESRWNEQSRTRSRISAISRRIDQLQAIKANLWSDQQRCFALHDEITKLRADRAELLQKSEPRRASGPLCLRGREADWA